MMSKSTKSPDKKRKNKRLDGSEQSVSQIGGQETDSTDSQALNEQQLATQTLENKQLEDLVAPLYDPGIDELPSLPNLKPVYDEAGKTLYLELCKEMNLVPVSYYLRHCEEPNLNLGHRGLGTLGVKAVCKALATNPYVYTLDLTDNWMGPQGMEYVSNLLQISIISELYLAQNNLGTAGAKLVGEVLYNNPANLKKLDISRNNFQDSDAIHIAYGLDGNDRLISINLSHNEFGVQAGKIFSNQVANTTLEHVDMSWNNFRAAGAVALATALKVTSINHLNLAWNGFGEEASVLLGRSIVSNTALQHLDLTSNRIGVNGAIAIGRALERNETLVTLKLAKNPITYEGSLVLLRSLAKGLTSGLKYLDLREVAVSLEFDMLYAQLLLLRDVQILYNSTDCNPFEIPIKSRRITTEKERLRRVKTLARESGFKIYQLIELLEVDVMSAIEFRTWLEMITKGLMSKVICDELATCLSLDGNIYKSLRQF